MTVEILEMVSIGTLYPLDLKLLRSTLASAIYDDRQKGPTLILEFSCVAFLNKKTMFGDEKTSKNFRVLYTILNDYLST